MEDDETIALGLVNALEHESYQVSHFENGESAVQAAGTHTPDLVLLDIMLPGMDGLEVLRRLKSQDPAPQVILLTAKTEELDRVFRCFSRRGDLDFDRARLAPFLRLADGEGDEQHLVFFAFGD